MFYTTKTTFKNPSNVEDFCNWMNSFDNEFLNLFTDDNTKSFVGSDYASAQFPPCNIYQDEEDNLVYEFALAGYSKDEISLSYKDDYITLKSNRADVEEKDGKKKKVYAQRGIKCRNFSTSYYVPLSKYDVSKLKSTLKDGLLKVTIPYSDKAKPKEFDICVE